MSQFSLEFKRHFGTSPVDYVLSQRLKQATYFLRDHNLTISEVALKVGFRDPFHFSRLFKKYHGISPLLYRRTVSNASMVQCFHGRIWMNESGFT